MDIDGLMVHYRDEGKGSPILLVHGTFSSLHTFDAWTRILKDNYRVIRLDLPGFGLTGPTPNGKYEMTYYLDLFVQFLKNLHIEKCHIAGSSLGGWLAWELCLAHPELINKLVLIGAAGYFLDQRLPLPFLMAQTPLINKFVKHVLPKGLVYRFLKEVYGDPNKVTDDLVTRYFDLVMAKGNREAFITLVNTKYEIHNDRVKNIQSPTLILWGKKDSWVTPKNADAFHADIKNSKLIVYDGVGHIPMEEIPVQSASDTIAFFQNGSVKP
jgi:pimeloyl-ACP methyl ester carboxylesterase